MTTKEFKMDDKTPFPLAYLDWCKFKGFKTIEETENRELLREFYKEVWEPLGKEVSGLDYAVAMGKMI